MVNISNGLSLFRAPLAFLFLQESQTFRLLAIVLAALTDCIDGYLARRYQSTSRFGAILDPAMDKFFVYFALTTFYHTGQVNVWEIMAMVSRDFFLCLYGILMVAMKRWKSVVFRSVRWGKVTTALQFVVLAGLVLQISFSWIIFAVFIAMGWLAFLELFQFETPIIARAK